MIYEGKKLRYTHEALADVLLTNPATTHKELAVMFDRTPVWVGYVINSDAFQVFLEKRREETCDPIVTFAIEERMRALANNSMDVLMEKLAVKPDAQLALKALEITTKALGYGARTQVEVNTNAAVQLNDSRPQLSKDEWIKLHLPMADAADPLAILSAPAEG
jgi:hypothetical protein